MLKDARIDAAAIEDDIRSLDGLIDGEEDDALGAVLAPIRKRLEAARIALATAELALAEGDADASINGEAAEDLIAVALRGDLS